MYGGCRLTIIVAEDKQVRLLSQEAGHFSLVRALHLADFITELNGMRISQTQGRNTRTC
jgi:hypothetical protein